MSSLLLLLSLILLIDVIFVEGNNVTLTNSSTYFKISRSDIMTLRNNNYQGITANISVLISYQIENNTENIFINDLLSKSFQQTIKNEYPSIGDEQIVIYEITTFLQETQNKSEQFTATILTAFLAYSLQQLQDINTFTVSTLGNELQNILNYTLRNNIKSLQSVLVHINQTQINNVKIDTNDLYNNPSDDNTNIDTDQQIEDELLYIFIVVAIITVSVIICIAAYIIKRRFNDDKISNKLELLEKSLLEDADGQYLEPKIKIPSSPVVENDDKDIIGGHNRNQSRLEMQLKSQKSDSYNRAKITSYDTPGYNGENDEDEEDENNNPDVINNEIDEYLAQSDDDENDDMYTTTDITTPQ